MPIYPAAMTTLAQPLMPPGRWHPARVTAAVLSFVALVLVITASFLPLYSGELDVGFDSMDVTITPWSAEFEGEGIADGADDVPRVGYPMVFAAVFLACAAAACWYAATPAARAAAGRAASLITAVSTAFLIGTAWTTALLVSNGVDAILLLGTLNEGLDTEASYLAGYWLLLTSCFLAFAASVLSLLPVRRPATWPSPPPQVNPFVATPPYGIALPVQAPPPARPMQLDPLTGRPVIEAPPGAVDPLTGQPLSPAAPSFPATNAAYPPFGQPLPPEAPIGGPPAGQPFQAPAVGYPLTGQPLPPAQAIPVSPPTGLPAAPQPFTAEPVGLVNGTPPVPVAGPAPVVEPVSVAEPAPIVLPDAPPLPERLPERLPGPAVPASEDPLAEPPRA